MTNANQSVVIKSSSRKRNELAEFSFPQEMVNQSDHSQIRGYHQAAWEAYQRLPFPTLRDEPWRRTDIRGLATDKFTIPENGFRSDPPARLLDPVIIGEEPSGRIVSGALEASCQLDESLAQQGVIFTHFALAEEKYPQLVGNLLGKIVAPDEDKFTALAAALGQDGVFLYVPKNVVIEQPLHSLYWGAGEDTAFINHLLLWLEDGASVTFVHESSSATSDNRSQVFHDGIVEIFVGQNARLTFVELQSWGRNVWSMTRERARVMGDGNLEWVFGAMGTHLTKNFSDIDLAEPGAMARMSGFYFTNGNQHLDHDTQQNHLAENTTSDLLYKGALLDASRSVWQGMIYVAPGADGTDGYQANRNLILSKQARADSIPGLEILADDVRCTHGATVGKIDENELFYLLSRGIPRKEAEQLIVMGFFAPIMARIPIEGVQNRFKEAITEKMAER
jgi:Fe-S cluster assembly protein SufD